MSPAPPFSESNIREKKVNPKFLRKQERVKFLFWDNKRSNESERSSAYKRTENRVERSLKERTRNEIARPKGKGLSVLDSKSLYPKGEATELYLIAAIKTE